MDLDRTKKFGGRMEFIGLLAVVLLDVFIVLNYSASNEGGIWLVPISAGDLFVCLLVNAVLILFVGHLLHDHQQHTEHTDITK